MMSGRKRSLPRRKRFTFTQVFVIVWTVSTSIEGVSDWFRRRRKYACMVPDECQDFAEYLRRKGVKLKALPSILWN